MVPKSASDKDDALKTRGGGVCAGASAIARSEEDIADCVLLIEGAKARAAALQVSVSHCGTIVGRESLHLGRKWRSYSFKVVEGI